MLFAMLLLLAPGTLLAQGKGQGKGRGKVRGEEAAEIERPEAAKKGRSASGYRYGKARQKHAKKKGATKGKKKGQYRTISHKNREKH